MNKPKTIVIVGATSEIGRDISMKLASEGFDLILTFNNSEERIKALEKEIKSKYKVRLSKIKLNLLTEQYYKFKEFISKISDNTLFGMVFCAGYTPKKNSFHEISIEEVKKTFLINVISVHEITSIISKKIKLNSSLKEGSIVFISSQIANFGNKGISAYASSKGALNSLAISLAKELGPDKIRVNTVSPGPVNISDVKKDTLNDKVKSIPLGRFCIPRDISNLVLFLLSPDSQFLNGVNIPLNGGR